MNYFQALSILNIKKDDSIDTITKAYRSAIKLAHPDHGGSSQQFMLIRDAYALIINQLSYSSKVLDSDGSFSET